MRPFTKMICNVANNVKITAPGISALNDLPTAGGTSLGILIVKPFFKNHVYISVEIMAIKIAVMIFDAEKNSGFIPVVVIVVEASTNNSGSTSTVIVKGIVTINETMAITNTSGCMCLTGICSINTKIPIKEEGVTVGRTMLQKEYGLYNSGIGKTHARVYKQDGNIFATDLGSKNGTYLNGEQLDKRVPVKMERGDILAFSDEEFILC